jgi:predicted small metal-binding protein
VVPALLWEARSNSTQEVHQRLVVYARENTRLTVINGHLVRDHATLSRRLKALEAALHTVELSGREVSISRDEPAEEAVGRYLSAK